MMLWKQNGVCLFFTPSPTLKTRNSTRSANLPKHACLADSFWFVRSWQHEKP
jgi:hypothetical protein